MSMLLLLVTAVLPVQQEFSWRGDLRAGQVLAVENIVGNVRVEAASGRRAEVVATKRAGRRGNPDEVEVTAHESSDGVRFCVRYPGMRGAEPRQGVGAEEGCWSWRGNRGRDANHDRNDTEVEFVVRLPAGVRLVARTVAGSVAARGMTADAEVTSVSGDVRVDEFGGEELEAKTVSGSIDLIGVRAARVGAETVSGDVTYDGGVTRDGSYEFKTLSGTVLVTLPSGAGADVRASTFSGRVRLPDGTASESTNRRRSRVTGRIGSGGATLWVESFSGNVDVRVGGER